MEINFQCISGEGNEITWNNIGISIVTSSLTLQADVLNWVHCVQAFDAAVKEL